MQFNGWFQAGVIFFLGSFLFSVQPLYLASTFILYFQLSIALVKNISWAFFFSAPTNKQHSNQFSVEPLLVHLEGFALSPWEVL